MKRHFLTIFLAFFLPLIVAIDASATPPVPRYHLYVGSMFKTKQRVFIINYFLVVNDIAELKAFLLTIPPNNLGVEWVPSAPDSLTKSELNDLRVFCEQHKIRLPIPMLANNAINTANVRLRASTTKVRPHTGNPGGEFIVASPLRSK